MKLFDFLHKLFNKKKSSVHVPKLPDFVKTHLRYVDRVLKHVEVNRVSPSMFSINGKFNLTWFEFNCNLNRIKGTTDLKEASYKVQRLFLSLEHSGITDQKVKEIQDSLNVLIKASYSRFIQNTDK